MNFLFFTMKEELFSIFRYRFKLRASSYRPLLETFSAHPPKPNSPQITGVKNFKIQIESVLEGFWCSEAV